MTKLNQIRGKIMEKALMAKTVPTEPVTFSLFLLEVLTDKEFKTLEAFERRVGTKAATAWYERLLLDTRKVVRASKQLSLRKAAG